MSEYIERERAIDALERIDWYHINDKGRLVHGGTSEMETYVPFKAVEEMLKSIPAADVRPVVLCRDCNYSYDSVGGWCCSHGICVDCIVREDFFCAEGEKREES